MARRRRYNRKRRKGNFAFLYKLLAFVLICGAIGLALAMFFRIDDIEISGSSRYTNQQITAAAEVRVGDNLFFLNKYDAAARIRQQLPYVETVQFRRVLPSKLVVQVTECRDPVAIKQDGTVYLLCDKGTIVDTVSAAKWSQYIQIEGLTLLDDKGMLHQVQVIDLSDAARITIRYTDRFDVQFLWDADFDYKLDYLAAVVDKLEDNEKGTIDMTQEGKASFIPS